MIFKYYINIDECNELNADVRHPDGTVVYEIHDIDHMWELAEGGYMESRRDVAGLQDYLIQTGVLTDGDRLVSGC